MDLARKLWRRLPLDGAPVLPLANGRARLFEKTAADAFWKRITGWRRLAAIPAARIAWAGACPLKTGAEFGAKHARGSDIPASLWAGWTRGKSPTDTILQRALARGDPRRLRLVRDIPGDRQSGLLLRALGSAADAALAADKLMMAQKLDSMGLPVPQVRALIEAGQMPRADAAPWSGSEKLLIKPRFGAYARGLFSVDCRASGKFSIRGGSPVGGVELIRHLTAAAGNDAMLVQPYLAANGETRRLSADAPAVIRVFTLRAGPGESATAVTAMLKILPPGMDAPHGIHELLVIPIDVESGILEEGILFDQPRERWARSPWNDAPLAGAFLSDWPRVRDMVEQASESLPGTPVVGWDVLLAEDGPVILEANTGISLFRAMLWHFEKGISSPVGEALENWCLGRGKSGRTS